MTFSDSDWTRDPPARPTVTSAQRRVLTLAIGLSLACLMFALGLYGIAQWLDANAHDDALRPPGETVATVPPAAPAPAVPSEPAAAPAAEPAPVAAAPASAVSQTERQQLDALEAEMKLRAKEAAEQAAAEAARRKERAWDRWYQRPAFCGDNPTSAQMIECANHHIRARRQFEERWATGRP
jgi:hypothetical protein